MCVLHNNPFCPPISSTHPVFVPIIPPINSDTSSHKTTTQRYYFVMHAASKVDNAMTREKNERDESKKGVLCLSRDVRQNKRIKYTPE